MSCLHEFSLRMHTYIGLQACFARKQTMLAGYEDSMLCSHVLACAAGLRRHLIPCERGEPAAVPYPGVRPSKAGLRPYLIPASGLRPWERGLRFYLVNFYQI